MALAAKPTAGCAEFEFDLVTPLFQQIAAVFASVDPVPLTTANLNQVDRRPGLYGLRHANEIVYVGKADDNVQGRLAKHHRQLQGRVGIAPGEVQFRCVYLPKTWDPFKPEESLQRELQPTWNSRGFGPNDPGRNRDMTVLGDTHWHVLYPLDPDWSCEGVQHGSYQVLDLLRIVANQAPYWVRFQGNRRGRADQTSAAQYERAREDFRAASPVFVPQPNMTVRQLLLSAVQSLPEPLEWQLTQLPSHLLLYREKNIAYPRGKRLWPSE